MNEISTPGPGSGMRMMPTISNGIPRMAETIWRPNFASLLMNLVYLVATHNSLMRKIWPKITEQKIA